MVRSLGFKPFDIKKLKRQDGEIIAGIEMFIDLFHRSLKMRAVYSKLGWAAFLLFRHHYIRLYMKGRDKK